MIRCPWVSIGLGFQILLAWVLLLWNRLVFINNLSFSSCYLYLHLTLICNSRQNPFTHSFEVFPPLWRKPRLLYKQFVYGTRDDGQSIKIIKTRNMSVLYGLFVSLRWTMLCHRSGIFNHFTARTSIYLEEVYIWIRDIRVSGRGKWSTMVWMDPDIVDVCLLRL